MVTINLKPPEVPPPLLTINNPKVNGKPLLTLNVVDGKLTAHYEAADLDEAAQLFMAYLMRSFELYGRKD